MYNSDDWTLWYTKRNGSRVIDGTRHEYTRVTHWNMGEQLLGINQYGSWVVSHVWRALSEEFNNRDAYHSVSYFQPDKWAQRGEDENSVETADTHYATCACYSCCGVDKYNGEHLWCGKDC